MKLVTRLGTWKSIFGICCSPRLRGIIDFYSNTHTHTSTHKDTATAAKGCVRIFLAFNKDFLLNF